MQATANNNSTVGSELSEEVAIGPKSILGMPIENGTPEQYRKYLWEVHLGEEPIEAAQRLGKISPKWRNPSRAKVMLYLGRLVGAIQVGAKLQFVGDGDHGYMLERYAKWKAHN